MAFIRANRLGQGRCGLAGAGEGLAWLVLLIAALAFLGCHNIPPVDTAPLDGAGMSYDAIEQLKSLHVTAPEVAEIVKAKHGGFSDAACVQVLQIFRGRKQALDAGDAIAGLVQAGMSENAIVQLAQINQLGISAGEWQAMRLADLSDEIILEVARHHAAGQPVLAGASLATLKNAGMREATLLELVRESVPDSQTSAILALRRHGANDREILRHFAGS
jgi:hypothetical protein